MKTQNFLLGLVVTIALTFTACGKKQPPAPSAYEVSGVNVDMPALQTAFVGAPQDAQAAVNDAASNLRYGQYVKALESLDKVASNPNLTEPQKKMVAQVIEQLKQVISKAGPSR